MSQVNKYSVCVTLYYESLLKLISKCELIQTNNSASLQHIQAKTFTYHTRRQKKVEAVAKEASDRRSLCLRIIH